MLNEGKNRDDSPSGANKTKLYVPVEQELKLLQFHVSVYGNKLISQFINLTEI